MRSAFPALLLVSLAYGQTAGPLVITSPANESAFRTGSEITLMARCALDSGSVKFIVDGASIGNAPCGGAFVWSGVPSGIHVISSVARAESEPVLVFVNGSATRPRVESVEGLVRAVVEDRFEQRTSRPYYSISSNGTSIPIAFPTPAVRAAVRSGKPVTLEGFRDSGRFYPRVTEVAEAANTAAPLTAFGVRRVAVILVNYPNDTDQPITRAQAASLMTTVNKFYQEASYQQFSVTTDVYGYLSLPINETCTTAGDTGGSDPFTAITTVGVQAAQRAGIDLSSYQTYFFVGPTATQCGGGIATVGGSPGLALIRANIYGAGNSQAGVIAHELGHNLGLWHSHSYACSTAIYSPNIDCGLIEYGDYFDVMGGAANLAESPHFNASDKNNLGWLSPQVVASTGNFTITPYEATGAAVKSLEIEPPFPSTADAFYLEFRQPIGFDSDLWAFGGTPPYNGLVVHLAGNPDFILNMDLANTQSYGPPTPALTPGEKYTDYANRFSVTAVSASPSALQVRVLIPSLTAPTAMLISPTNGSVVGGTVTITADALDLNAVTKLNLYIDNVLIGTQTGSVSQPDAVVKNENYSLGHHQRNYRHASARHHRV